jgi:hypothetical protein
MNWLSSECGTTAPTFSSLGGIIAMSTFLKKLNQWIRWSSQVHFRTVCIICGVNSNTATEGVVSDWRLWSRGSAHTKKDGTNGLAVRAGRPVTQITSSEEGDKRCHLINWNKYTLA